jgi:hypothetical protein
MDCRVASLLAMTTISWCFLNYQPLSKAGQSISLPATAFLLLSFSRFHAFFAADFISPSAFFWNNLSILCSLRTWFSLALPASHR